MDDGDRPADSIEPGRCHGLDLLLQGGGGAGLQLGEDIERVEVDVVDADAEPVDLDRVGRQVRVQSYVPCTTI